MTANGHAILRLPIVMLLALAPYAASQAHEDSREETRPKNAVGGKLYQEVDLPSLEEVLWRIAASFDDPRARDERIESIALAYSDAGRPELAIFFTRMIEDTPRRVGMFIRIANPLIEKNDHELAAKVLQEALDTVMSGLTQEDSSLCLALIARLLAKTGRTGPALEAARAIGPPPGHQVRPGSPGVPRREYQALKRVSALAAVGEALAQQGDRDGAREVLDEALAAAKSIAPVGNVFGGSGVVPSRREAMRRVTAGLVSAGHPWLARSVWAEEVDAALGIENATVKAWYLGWIGWHLADQDQGAMARLVLKEALDAAMQPKDFRGHRTALSQVASGFVKAGDIQSAVKAAASLPPSYIFWQLSPAPAVARELARSGKAETLREVSETLLKAARSTSIPSMRVRDMASIGQALIDVGDMQAAIETFTETMEVARSLGPAADMVLRHILDTHGRTGGKPLPSEFLAILLHVTETLEPPGVRNLVLAAAPNALVRAGNEERALEMARSFVSLPLRITSLVAAASALAEVGQKRQAVSVLTEALSAAQQINSQTSLQRIAETFVKLGEDERAVETVQAIESDTHRYRALQRVLHELGMSRQPERLERVAEKLLAAVRTFPKVDERRRLLISLGTAGIRAGLSPEQGRRLAARIEHLAKEAPIGADRSAAPRESPTRE